MSANPTLTIGVNVGQSVGALVPITASSVTAAIGQATTLEAAMATAMSDLTTQATGQSGALSAGIGSITSAQGASTALAADITNIHGTAVTLQTAILAGGTITGAMTTEITSILSNLGVAVTDQGTLDADLSTAQIDFNGAVGFNLAIAADAATVTTDLGSLATVLASATEITISADVLVQSYSVTVTNTSLLKGCLLAALTLIENNNLLPP